MPQTKPPVTMESVAQFFCEKSGWTLTSLKLQKLMYFAQLYYMGGARHRLFDGAFEARTHGPALRALYGVVKDFGKDTPIARGSFGSPPRIEKDSDAYKILSMLYKLSGHKSLADLCSLSRREDGAWIRHYSWHKVNTIADKSILQEYDHAEARALATRK